MRPDDIPVVLAHGWGSAYDLTWRGTRLEQAIRAAGRRIIQLDLPGHGRRPQPHDPAAYADMSGLLYRCFEHEPVIDAVGFSLGGKLLLDLATRHPACLRHLVVAGVGTNLFRAENGELITEALLAPSIDGMPAAVRNVASLARSSGNDVRALSAVIRRPPSRVRHEALARITAPVLLIAGRNDAIIGDAAALGDLIPSCRVVWLDGTDHLETPKSAVFHDEAIGFICHGAEATSGVCAS